MRVADDVVLAESVSMAMMLVVENLSPDERAVFVLREVFGFGHDDIAAAVGMSPAAVRHSLTAPGPMCSPDDRASPVGSPTPRK